MRLKHLQTSEGGALEYRRRVPATLQEALGRSQVKLGLGTDDPLIAGLVAMVIDDFLDHRFAALELELDAEAAIRAKIESVAVEAETLAGDALARVSRIVGDD